MHTPDVEELEDDTRPVRDLVTGEMIIDPVTCDTCGRTWNNAHISSVTPAPSGRCPFEYDHDGLEKQ